MDDGVAAALESMLKKTTQSHFRYDANSGTLYLLTYPSHWFLRGLRLVSLPVFVLALIWSLSQIKKGAPCEIGIAIGLLAILIFVVALLTRKEYAFQKNADTFTSVMCFPAFVQRWKATRDFGWRQYPMYRESYVEIAKWHETYKNYKQTWFTVTLYLKRGQTHELVGFSNFTTLAEAKDIAQLIAHQLSLEVRRMYE